MNQVPEGQPNVASLEEFLRDTLEETETLIEGLDQAVEQVRNEFRGRREHLRARLYAFRLAEDSLFDAEVRQLAEGLSNGNQPPTFSIEAVLERQGQ